MIDDTNVRKENDAKRDAVTEQKKDVAVASRVPIGWVHIECTTDKRWLNIKKGLITKLLKMDLWTDFF